jgi:GNAT superfamily N-acetyltransferase
MTLVDNSRLVLPQVVAANYLGDHKAIVKISKEETYIHLDDVRFIQQYYADGCMGKLVIPSLVGYVLMRHCKRSPWSTIYYAGVTRSERGKGYGRRLFDWVVSQTPHQEIRLGVIEGANEALQFWKHLGFTPTPKEFTITKGGLKVYQLRLELDKRSQYAR